MVLAISVQCFFPPLLNTRPPLENGTCSCSQPNQGLSPNTAAHIRGLPKVHPQPISTDIYRNIINIMYKAKQKLHRIDFYGNILIED